MEYEWLLFVFLLLINWQLWRLTFLLAGFVVGLAKVIKLAEKGDLTDITNEMFMKEFNRRFSSTRENK
jgi:hypothetical protein